jgi:hypothetical protein
MNFHTKLIGAFDAVILVAAALLTIAFTAALFNPSPSRVAQLPAAATSESTRTI